MNYAKSKILIISSSKDRTVDYIIDKFPSSFSVVRINTDKLEDYQITIANDDVVIIANDYELNLREIKAIYYRKPTYPRKVLEFDRSYTRFLKHEFKSFLFGLTEVFDGRIITNPFILNKASNKILQLKVAKDVGLRLPETLISNDPSAILRRIQDSGKRWVVKPLSTGRLTSDSVVYTNLIDNRHLFSSSLESIRLAPHIFQEFIDKEFDLRVTVVGQKIFPVKIYSNRVDWRTGDVEYEYTTIPEELKLKCFSFMKKLAILFCAFDFVYWNGDYYFLEGNPNGQWLWLEMELGIPISEAIVELLVE